MDCKHENEINACDPESDDIDMLKFEYKLVIEQIRHYDAQAHYITHFGLALFISSLLAALYLYDKSPILSSFMLIGIFLILGIIGHLLRRSTGYLKGLAAYSRKIESRLNIKFSRCISDIRQKQFNDWENKFFKPRLFRYLKWIILLIALFILWTSIT